MVEGRRTVVFLTSLDASFYMMEIMNGSLGLQNEILLQSGAARQRGTWGVKDLRSTAIGGAQLTN